MGLSSAGPTSNAEPGSESDAGIARWTDFFNGEPSTLRELGGISSRYLACLGSVSLTTLSVLLVDAQAEPLFGTALFLVLVFFQGFLQPWSNGPRRDAERMNNGWPCRYDSASRSIRCRFAARSISSSSSSDPSKVPESMSLSGGGAHVSKVTGETGRGKGIGVGYQLEAALNVDAAVVTARRLEKRINCLEIVMAEQARELAPNAKALNA